jgi:hypothetical protein
VWTVYVFSKKSRVVFRASQWFMLTFTLIYALYSDILYHANPRVGVGPYVDYKGSLYHFRSHSPVRMFPTTV